MFSVVNAGDGAWGGSGGGGVVFILIGYSGTDEGGEWWYGVCCEF